MPVVFSYLIKLSVSLAVVFLFYQLVLRRLTFYNWNRWYLLGYTFLSFFIPFIDITTVLEKNDLSSNDMITWIPAITVHVEDSSDQVKSFTFWNGIILFFGVGVAIMLLRLLIQLISFYRMKQKAVPVAENGLNIFHVNENIIPFSFGNSIFINRDLHSESELEEIIRHEFIHVKQKHSLDIIWGELLCMLNWYNPFAWLLKRSIRQNLEFIADNKVIENGINKREYQYLLLKVIGNTQFSIATQFNFSSLKKRIAMMNKTKSAKRQAARFLFLLPVFAIILLSFRKSFSDSAHSKTGIRSIIITDTVPEVTEPNSKGYFIDVKDNKGHCMVVVKDKNKKEVTRLLLTEWNEKADHYESLYGKIPPAPQPVGFVKVLPVMQKVQLSQPVEISQPALLIPVQNNTGAEFNLEDDKLTVKLKDGKTEVYNLKDDKEKKQFIEKYDDPVLVATTINSNVSVDSKITPVLVTTLKSNLITSDINAVTVTNSNLSPTINADNPINAKLATTISSPAVVNLKNQISTVIEPDMVTTIDVDIIIEVKNTATQEDLDNLITKMKEKGYELKFTNKDYKDGILKNIQGTIKSKDSNSSFSATDFTKLIISAYKDEDQTRFRIDIQTKKNKTVV